MVVMPAVPEAMPLCRQTAVGPVAVSSRIGQSRERGGRDERFPRRVGPTFRSGVIAVAAELKLGLLD